MGKALHILYFSIDKSYFATDPFIKKIEKYDFSGGFSDEKKF